MDETFPKARFPVVSPELCFSVGSSAVVALAVPQDCYSSGWSTINTLKAQSPTLPPEQSTPLATLRLPAPASP